MSLIFGELDPLSTVVGIMFGAMIALILDWFVTKYEGREGNNHE